MFLYKSNMDSSPFETVEVPAVIEKWSERETLVLISAYKLFKEYFSQAKRKKFVWEHISQHLANEGIYKSRIHVETKWKSLLRTYRKYMSSTSFSPTSTVRFKYMDELIDAMGCEEQTIDDPVVNDDASVGNDSDSSDECIQQNGDISYDIKKRELISEEEEEDDLQAVKKRRTSHSNTYDHLVRLKKQYLKCIIEDINSKRNHREEYVNILMKEQELKKLRDQRRMQLKAKQLEIEERKAKLLENYLHFRQS